MRLLFRKELPWCELALASLVRGIIYDKIKEMEILTMGVLDKLLNVVKLNDEFEGDDDDFLDDDLLDDEEDYLDDEEDIKPSTSFFKKFGKKKSVEEDIDFLDEDDEDEDDDLIEPVKAKKEKKEKEKKVKEVREEAPKPAFRTMPSFTKTASAPKTEKTVKTEKVEKVSRPAAASSKITPMRSSKRNNNSQEANMEVCVIKPKSMEDAHEIADTLLDNSTVVLNLEGIDVELAQRISDFSVGACYSLGGHLQQVSSCIFLLVPYNVYITGDLHNVLGDSAPFLRVGY
jgi:cell division inhibitor SepF